jgi:hypothetical protein
MLPLVVNFFSGPFVSVEGRHISRIFAYSDRSKMFWQNFIQFSLFSSFVKGSKWATLKPGGNPTK